MDHLLLFSSFRIVAKKWAFSSRARFNSSSSSSAEIGEPSSATEDDGAPEIDVGGPSSTTEDDVPLKTSEREDF